MMKMKIQQSLILSVAFAALALAEGALPEQQPAQAGHLKIPHRLIFTYSSNILETRSPVEFYDNIVHSIQVYKEAWSADNDGQDGEIAFDDDSVWFLDDAECRATIAEVEPALVPHFDAESKGAFKSDICRIAALYLSGGYYMDIDMKVIQAVPIPPDTEFATVMMDDEGAFFQSFLASEPANGILRQALDEMLHFYDEKEALHKPIEDQSIDDWSVEEALAFYGGDATPSDHLQEILRKYKEDTTSPSRKRDLKESIDRFHYESNLHRGLMGPSTLKHAYDLVANATSNTFILREANLEEANHAGLYPSLKHQQGYGPNCNYIVHDSNQPYFFSRMVNGGPLCRDLGVVMSNMTDPTMSNMTNSTGTTTAPTSAAAGRRGWFLTTTVMLFSLGALIA